MKRKWLMIPIVTGLLAAGLTGASALAHNEDGENESPKETVAAKVAEILGIEDEQTVKDAIQQATTEVRLDRLEHRLGHMVENEVLTQEQADEYLAWYADRPDIPNLHRNGHRLFGFGGGDGEGGQPEGQGQFRGQRFGGQDGSGFGQRPDGSGFGQRPDGGDGSDARQLPNGRQFPGRGDARSRFGQRFGDQQFPGQGQLPPGLGGEIPSGEVPGIEIPEGNGASF
jgi:hypothetical protein